MCAKAVTICWPSPLMILHPKRPYFLCTMPRSGSTLLCDLLSQTGVAGKPNSFFRPQSMADFAADWEIPAQTIAGFDRTYVETALTQGTAGTGCFGMRIMWNTLAPLTARLAQLCAPTATDLNVLQAAFGPLKFIHLSRSDKVAEAVSLDIAEQSGLWHRNADGSERERAAPAVEPIYDHARLLAAYQEVSAGDTAWVTWFAQQGIAPLRISYEDLAVAPTPQLRRILSFIGADPDKANGIAPKTARLADPRNRAWTDRFRAETDLAPPASAT